MTLDAAKKLGAKIVCTGHGPRSAATVLDDQQAFFTALREQLGATLTKSPSEEAKTRIESILAMLKSKAQIARQRSTPPTSLVYHCYRGLPEMTPCLRPGGSGSQF